MVPIVTVVLALAVVGAGLWWWRRERGRVRGIARVEDELAAAERVASEPGSDALSRLRRLAPEVERARGARGERLRAHLLLLEAELASDAGRRDTARGIMPLFAKALAHLPQGDEHTALEARADVVTILVAGVEDATEDEFAAGRRALDRATIEVSPDALMRLVWAAHWMGRIHQRRGDWPTARRMYERAAEVAKRLERPRPDADLVWSGAARERFWTYGRRSASTAMLEIADVARTMGDATTARRAYSEAITLLEGAVTPEARLGRARALLARGLQDVSDELAGPGARLRLLDEASSVAIGIGQPAGNALAARAELEMARLRDGVGDPGGRVAHLGRAIECAARAGAEGAALAVEANFTMGSHLEQEGTWEEACGPLRTAYLDGRAHQDLHVRWMAFLAGVSLHAILLTHAQVDEARELLLGLADVVPVLSTESRARAAARIARSRAQQLRFEAKSAEAEEAFQDAAKLARHVDSAERGVLVFRIQSDWGGMLAETGRDADAESRFTAAMDVPDALAGPAEVAERAEVLVQRAQVRLKMDRKREAVEDLRLAFDMGRSGGTSHGRDVAALAALVMGDAMRRQTDERKRHYETAARLGMLSGTERGRQVARAARLRMRAIED